MLDEGIAHDILFLLRSSEMGFNNNPIYVGMDLVVMLADIESSVIFWSLLTSAGSSPKIRLFCTISNHIPIANVGMELEKCLFRRYLGRYNTSEVGLRYNPSVKHWERSYIQTGTHQITYCCWTWCFAVRGSCKCSPGIRWKNCCWIPPWSCTVSIPLTHNWPGRASNCFCSGPRNYRRVRVLTGTYGVHVVSHPRAYC
jgi:hypothetical protein